MGTASKVVKVANDDVTIYHAVVWRVDASGQLLVDEQNHVLPPIDLEPNVTSQAWARDVQIIDNQVRVAGQALFNGVTGEAHAIVWTLNAIGQISARSDLGTLGGQFSAATGLNGNGDASGLFKHNVHDQPAICLVQNGSTMINLGSLGTYSRAWDINDNGAIAGRYEILNKRTAQTAEYAFVYEDGAMQDLLGKISGRTSWTRLFNASGLNNGGDIVGTGMLGKDDRPESGIQAHAHSV